jgi:hypothetical protein
MNAKSIIMTCAVLLSSLAINSKAADSYPLRSDGFIRDWLMLAPIQCGSDSDGAAEIQKNQIPDEGQLKPKAGDKAKVAGKELTWKKVKATDYYLDLNAAVNQQTEKTVGYAVAYVRADEERKNLQLKMGSNDQGRVYLNGKQLLKTTEPRSLEEDADVARNVTLNKGINVVVFKIFNEGGSDWQGCVRFADANGKPLTNVMIQLEPE